jgi:hypothetical protein
MQEVFNWVGSRGTRPSEYVVTAGANTFTVTKGSCAFSYVLMQDPIKPGSGSTPSSEQFAGDCPSGSYKTSADLGARTCVLCPPGSYR